MRRRAVSSLPASAFASNSLAVLDQSPMTSSARTGTRSSPAAGCGGWGAEPPADLAVLGTDACPRGADARAPAPWTWGTWEAPPGTKAAALWRLAASTAR
eukprot:CAMPEP_0179336484 /NCGR_PEP_ID=MMETSP0797-20121207/67070_1 /TAXON_ID=47934 /ORGANISM="Dinophysis acuminata, Strain DAEP01" /LENGTH=99 /DNA_ID=CAMNT_0021049979 /DNA_START=17 /DNA_END=312 /DNA_ORIENTATION=+